MFGEGGQSQRDHVSQKIFLMMMGWWGVKNYGKHADVMLEHSLALASGCVGW